MRGRRWAAAVTVALTVGCTAPAAAPAPAPPATSAAGPATGATAPGPQATGTATAATAVLVGAGDIATCDGSGDTRTAALLEDIPGTVFTLGDNVYARGTPAEFARCYEPTWGRVRERTRPVVGNHEYGTRGAAGHFGYFGAAAGPPDRGYYAYDAGEWRVIVLNTNCDAVPGGCDAGSPQQRWLRDELAANPARCTAAMAHHPLFTSAAAHGPATGTRPLVRTLVDAGVELLLAGHNHQYERFAPQTADGRRDDARGIRAFVVGTGGAGLYPFRAPARNSEVRDNTTYGVLRLTLSPGAYRWDFVPVPGGELTDRGAGTCH